MSYVPRGTAQATLIEFLRAETDDCLLWPHTTKSTNGYGRIKVNGKMGYVHIVVCERRHGPRPSPSHEAAHSCGKPGCGNYRHLRWATRVENEHDKLRSAKLTVVDVLEIRRRVAFESIQSLAQEFGVTLPHVQDIVAGRAWTRLL